MPQVSTRVRLPLAVRLAPLLALYLAVCALAQPGEAPVRDEISFLGYADRLLEGEYIDRSEQRSRRGFLWHGPGLPLVLAPLRALEVPLPTMRFLGPLLLFAAVLLFHRLLRLRLAPRPALAWTLALGLYVPVLAMLRNLQKEPLAILLLVVALLGLTRGLEAQGRRRHLVLAGAALGWLALVRLEYGAVALALGGLAALAWLAGRLTGRPRARRIGARVVAVAAVALAMTAPWLAYTHHITDRVGYWGNASGLSLFWMSPTLPGETGQWYPEWQVHSDPALAAARPFFRAIDPLEPVAHDDALRAAALDNIRAEPLRYARNIAANATRMLFGVPMRPAQRPVTIAVLVAFNGLLLIGLVAAARTLWRRRGRLPAETAPAAALALLGLGVHLLPSAQPRMLFSLVPLLIWLVAQGAHAAMGSRRGRRRGGPARVDAVALEPRGQVPRDDLAAPALVARAER